MLPTLYQINCPMYYITTKIAEKCNKCIMRIFENMRFTHDNVHFFRHPNLNDHISALKIGLNMQEYKEELPVFLHAVEEKKIAKPILVFTLNEEVIKERLHLVV